ncbi:MAG TPA: septum formation initiator family protein [Ignavibacteria bacterium]|mgnify:CR=1 FL=1|nr:septum formation initiator family protein [Ignavibacteria bacterium]
MKEDSFGKNMVRYILHRKKFFLYLLVLLLILGYAVFGKKGILQRVELEMENRELREKLKTEQDKSLMLQKEIEDLKTSDKKIEKVAREKYNLVKDGEEIYKVMTDSTK